MGDPVGGDGGDGDGLVAHVCYCSEWGERVKK
jgi:hypothetical protein